MRGESCCVMGARPGSCWVNLRETGNNSTSPVLFYLRLWGGEVVICTSGNWHPMSLLFLRHLYSDALIYGWLHFKEKRPRTPQMIRNLTLPERYSGEQRCGSVRTAAGSWDEQSNDFPSVNLLREGRGHLATGEKYKFSCPCSQNGGVSGDLACVWASPPEVSDAHSRVKLAASGHMKWGWLFFSRSSLDSRILKNVKVTDVLNVFILCMHELWGVLLSVLLRVNCGAADLWFLHPVSCGY